MSAVLSPAQYEVAVALCVGGTYPAAALTARAGITGATLATLCRLGVIEVRRVGGLAPLCHITHLGRALVCGQRDDASCVVVPPAPAGPLHEQEEPTMNATTAKPDPKPARRRAPGKAAASAPPIEDVTGNPPASVPAVDLDGLESILVGEIAKAVGKLDKIDKQAYTRLMHDGALVGYVRRSKKGLLIQLEARVADEASVAAAVATIQSAFALR